MHGSYFFVTEHGERFDVPIALFVLEAMRRHAACSRCAALSAFSRRPTCAMHGSPARVHARRMNRS